MHTHTPTSMIYFLGTNIYLQYLKERKEMLDSGFRFQERQIDESEEVSL